MTKIVGQQHQIGQVAERDRGDDDDAACQADGQHAIRPKPVASGPSSSTLSAPPAL